MAYLFPVIALKPVNGFCQSAEELKMYCSTGLGFVFEPKSGAASFNGAFTGRYKNFAVHLPYVKSFAVLGGEGVHSSTDFHKLRYTSVGLEGDMG